MIIRSNNFVLKLEEILKDKLPTERYNEHENIVLKIIREWFSPAEFFTHQTSGSTGRPKKIAISRDNIEISTKATLDAIDPNRLIRTSLLCLDPMHIGGAMVIYRALIAKHDLTIVKPTSNPIEQIGAASFDLVSLVPMQYKSFTDAQLNQFGTILIGGAPMEVMKTKSTAKIYSTFGMTETVSHIALRPIQDEIFKTTGDTIIATDDEGILKIKGSITGNEWLITNDLVDAIDQHSFKWKGRKDFVINSGGIKNNPEEIEMQLKDKIGGDFMVGSLPDEVLGRKLVLILDGNTQAIDFSHLDKYKRPKELYFNQIIYKTPSGKLDRMKTQNSFEQSL